MGVQGGYKGVEGICRGVREYMGVQRRYKRVEGIYRGVRGYMGVYQMSPVQQDYLNYRYLPSFFFLFT